MTVPSTPRKAGPFTGTGALTNYPFSFKVFQKEDLAVTTADTNGLETAGVLDSTFLVTLNPDQETTPGGSVQYAVGGVWTGLPVGYRLAIDGTGLDYDQSADLPQGGNFDPVVIENALDRLEMQIQNLRDNLTRTLQGAVTGDATLTLPAPVALSLLGWSADATALVNYALDVDSAAGLQTRLANPNSLVDGDAMLAVKRAATGAVARTQHQLNEELWFNVKDFGAVGDGVTDDSAAIQAAVNAAIASSSPSNVVYFPRGTFRVVTRIELNDQAGATTYRPSIKIRGAGMGATRILHNVTAADSVHGRALFQHKLTQTQGDNSYFAFGLEFQDFGIYSNGSTHAAAAGISLGGAFNPMLTNVLVSGMGTGGGIVVPSDSRWPGNSDRYTCADFTMRNVVVVSTVGGYGVKNQNYATAFKILEGCYIILNTGGGVYLEGCNHHIAANAIAYNGSASGYGLHINRSSEGNARNVYIDDGIEFDGNFTNHIRFQGCVSGYVGRVRIKDTVAGGTFCSPTSIKLIGTASGITDLNLLENVQFDYINAGAAVAVTSVSIDLDVDDGRSVRYNKFVNPTFNLTGSVTHTPISFGTNPNASNSFGNRYYPREAPPGTVRSNTFSKNAADASGLTTVITGLGFRPLSISFDMVAVSAGTYMNNGVADCSTLGPSNYGTHNIGGTNRARNDSNVAIQIETSAGVKHCGTVTATSDDGFTITWTKTGAPTGTFDITYYAVR